MARMLRGDGDAVNRKRVQRLMRLMGIAALGPKPRTSTPAPGHRIFPYLLRSLRIDRPNQVWAADITYLPIGRGFLYLVAIMDWTSRAVLSWRLSQGSQFTSAAFTGVLEQASIQISMDGRGRWMDNVFTERLWRSLKHEDVYLKGYADGRKARHGIAAWVEFYNRNRPHQALGYATPMAVWCDGVVDALAARAVDVMDNARALPTCPQPQTTAKPFGRPPPLPG
jgi:putative transposase